MATARLVASSYSSSNSSYATVNSGADNLYENTSNTSYASLRGRNRNSTTAYYIFVKGFNFNSIPSNATVTSFSVKVKCYRNSYQRTGANYRIRLASTNNIDNVIADTTLDEDITTTSGGTVYTIPTGDITWNTLKNTYGSNFSVVFPLSSTSSSRPYIYVYGIEIEVTYNEGGGSSEKIYVKENGTWNQYSKVYQKVNGVWVEQASSTWSTLFNTNTNYRKMS